ncbi:MAG: hypothetical protein M1827_002038 [Pycnora praestabilis]|nr:MAG: hypothetical protein M1827_002038 [Pycnora praestabilis]
MAEPGHVQFNPHDIHSVESGSGSEHQAHSPQGNPHLREKSDLARVDTQTTSQANEHGVQEGDLRVRQNYSAKVVFWLAYQSVGVIYGDIGTSPLYVYSSTFSSAPSYDDLVGALSLIIWTLLLVVSVKYVLIVLFADDEGEGGTFALYSLISRYANIIQRDPKEASLIKLKRYRSDEMKPSTKSFRAVLENSKVAKIALKFFAVLGVSLIMADGVLTPAQSVLGAIQGLEVVKPDISTGTIVGVTCGILVLFFLVQPLGTSKIAGAFAPVIIIWLLFNMVFGCYNLAQHDHSVLKAFSPYFAGSYLVRNKTEGWKSLGGILLAFTGVEALFADLGAFNRKSIQLSWLCFCFPCLLLAYIGQAAYISNNPSAYSNPFFNSVPPGMFYPSLVLSILAAIVASQAIVISTFQLLSQIMKLSYFPQIKLIHTSNRFHGQIYIPFANWLLLIGTLIVTGVYHNTTRLGNAYGVCVILVTFITTCMVSLVALVVWKLHFLIVLVGFLVFGTLDGLYLSSAMTKVPSGAWFTLMLATMLSLIFILWRYGKEQQWKAERAEVMKPSQLIDKSVEGGLHFSTAMGGGEIVTFKGFGIFFDKAGDGGLPTVFSQFVRKFAAVPEVIVFFHMRPLGMPSVAIEDRYTVTRVGIYNCFRVTVRHGYTDVIITEDLAPLILDQIRNFTIREGTVNQSSAFDAIEGDLVYMKLNELEQAYRSQIIYLLGKESLRLSSYTNILKRLVLIVFLWLRDNTRSKMASMKIPGDQLVEVGFIKDM